MTHAGPREHDVVVPPVTGGEQPAEGPLWVYRGDTCGWRFRLWADSERTEPFGLTGAQVAAQVRRTPDDRVAADLICQVAPPNMVAVLLPAETSARTPTGRWDLRLAWPPGDQPPFGTVRTVVAGPVTVEPDVTR